jgi:hypothetical protein
MNSRQAWIKSTKDHREASPHPHVHNLACQGNANVNGKRLILIFITWNQRPIRHALFTHVFGTPAAQR